MAKYHGNCNHIYHGPTAVPNFTSIIGQSKRKGKGGRLWSGIWCKAPLTWLHLATHTWSHDLFIHKPTWVPRGAYSPAAITVLETIQTCRSVACPTRNSFFIPGLRECTCGLSDLPRSTTPQQIKPGQQLKSAISLPCQLHMLPLSHGTPHNYVKDTLHISWNILVPVGQDCQEGSHKWESWDCHMSNHWKKES